MTNAEAKFNKSLRPRKPEGSLGWTAQDVHLNSHTAPELCAQAVGIYCILFYCSLHWGTMDAEVKGPSAWNPELSKLLPFKA